VTQQTMRANDADFSVESQRELAAGVLKQAAQDLRRFHGATSRVERELYFDAYRWVMSDDYSWPFSFPNVCQILNRHLEELREELIGDLALGPFGHWARRCGRALRQFLDSVTKRFASDNDLSTPLPAHLVQTWH